VSASYSTAAAVPGPQSPVPVYGPCLVLPKRMSLVGVCAICELAFRHVQLCRCHIIRDCRMHVSLYRIIIQ
jgi:hypothetical protein